MAKNEIFQPGLLEAFRAVVETRSFSRAAAQLGLAQSSVSTKVARLERSTGRRLLARSTHEVKLTPDGEAMIAYGRIVLELQRHAERHFSSSPIDGSIRLGLSAGVQLGAAPLAFGRLRELHPRLHLTLKTGTNENLLNRFDDGELDLVLGLKSVGQGRGDVLFSEPISWFGDQTLTADRTAPIPLAVRSGSSFLRRQMVRSLSECRRIWAVKFESDSFDALRAAVLGGLGVTAVPRCFFASSVPMITTANLPRIPDVEFFLVVQPEAAEHTKAFASILRDAAPDIIGRTMIGQSDTIGAVRSVNKLPSLTS